MSMKYIRDTYGCPAKRGMKILFWKCEHSAPRRGIIKASRGQYLRVCFIGNIGMFTMHPTWNIKYIDGDWPDDWEHMTMEQGE
jgi:hypothetical protein